MIVYHVENSKCVVLNKYERYESFHTHTYIHAYSQQNSEFDHGSFFGAAAVGVAELYLEARRSIEDQVKVSW